MMGFRIRKNAPDLIILIRNITSLMCKIPEGLEYFFHFQFSQFPLSCLFHFRFVPRLCA
jgi:hypothetical protein